MCTRRLNEGADEPLLDLLHSAFIYRDAGGASWRRYVSEA